jgi:hypothetical protein
MKGYYSRHMQEQVYKVTAQTQGSADQAKLNSRLKQRQLMQRTNEIRQQKKLEEARQRLEELQRQQEEQARKRDHRDRYIQFLRKGSKKSVNRPEPSKLQALDLEVGSHIPKPSKLQAIKPSHRDRASKIPRLPPRGNGLWVKGDLLDSLDLGSTNLLGKRRQFEIEEEAPAPEVTHSPLRGGKKESKVFEQDSLEGKDWLRDSVKQSIQEWAGMRPVKITAPSAISEKAEEFEAEIRKVLELEDSPKKAPKASKYVQRIKQIRQQPEDDFLSVRSMQNELACLDAEELKLQASIARLDSKIVAPPLVSKPRLRKQSQETEERMLEASLDRLSNLLENHSVFGSEAASVFSAPDPKISSKS